MLLTEITDEIREAESGSLVPEERDMVLVMELREQMTCLGRGEISAVGLDPSLHVASEEDDVAGFMQNQSPYEKKFVGKRPWPTSSSSSLEDQLPHEDERQMKQRILEADGKKESLAVPASSSTSSNMMPLMSCCTCGHGIPFASRVGCRGLGCWHSVCTSRCACYEPERQRRIGWTYIEAPLVEAQHEEPHRPTSSSDSASHLGETSLSRRLPDCAELEPA